MFEALPPAEPDRILALIALSRDDPRPEKIDLGVGVYRDSLGETPVFRAVRAAEARLLEAERTKTYLGLIGDPEVCASLGRRVLGDDLLARAAVCQSTGGTGAIFALARLAQAARPGLRAWLPCPTWPNHANILRAVGLATAEYPHLDPAGRELDFPAMAAALETVPAGDLVILHGCCHNPSGADPSAEQWRTLAEIAGRRGWIPFFDLAYPGLGRGWDEDVAGLRALCAAVPEALVAVSGSKTFGLYRDRAGAAFALAGNAADRGRAQDTLAAINRNVHSMPPWRGGAVIRTVLDDPELCADWAGELETMRRRIAANRARVAQALARRPGGQGWSFVGAQQGMFSLLGLSDAQVTELRERHAVYVVPGGRVNFAGLGEGQEDRFAEALLAVA